MKKFFKQLFCFHGKKNCWKVIDISYDGVATAECVYCGARKKRGL